MTSSVRQAVFLLSALVAAVVPARAQSPVRMAAGSGAVSDRFSGRVARALAKEWDVDSGKVVLSWGSGSLGQVPDSIGFRLIGGDAGWFSVQTESAGGAVAWLRLRAGVTVDRPVATRALPAGSVIGDDDLRIEPRIHWGPPPPDSEPVAQVGWLVKRPVNGGEALEGYRVSPPPVVSAGKPVRVLYSIGNVSVALEGVALNDAAVGQPVRVRTSTRIGTVAGTAIAPGEARMN